MTVFDICAECRLCCAYHRDVGVEAICLTLAEQQKFGRTALLIEEGGCEFLGLGGCTLTDASKPLACYIFPLCFDPENSTFHYDSECPAMREYLTQLTSINHLSVAWRHYFDACFALADLRRTDLEFLRKNYAMDAAAYQLKPLKLNGPLAQCTVEQPVLNRQVEGSSPSRLTIQHELPRQPWTPENVAVFSSCYEGAGLWFTRWESLCPYVDVTKEIVDAMPRPCVIYGIPRDSEFGVLTTVKYGHVSMPIRWSKRTLKKTTNLAKGFVGFKTNVQVVSGSSISFSLMEEWGGEQFTKYDILAPEVRGFVDYIRELDCVLIQTFSPEGELVFTDFSIILPERNQLYGVFCNWNQKFKARSPGLYACLLAAHWAEEHGCSTYNLGSLFGYKIPFVDTYEPTWGIVLADENSQFWNDPTSELHLDFERDQWNVIYRKDDPKTQRWRKREKESTGIL